MPYLLYGIFCLSGASALIFETIWFRLTGLIFGNSVWSASLILAGFMGGLALGNGLISRYGDRVKQPVSFYAWLEFAIAISGVSLVIILPQLEKWLTPLFRPFLHIPWALNMLRLSLAFLLILIPTTAMGATLPLLVKTLSRNVGNFGSALGSLYGVNTLGAVLGALSGELFLIQYAGIRGTGLTAALLNFLAAFFSLRIAKHFDLQDSSIRKTKIIIAEKVQLSTSTKRLLFVAFLSGGVILSLEVIWFRFMLLFRSGTSFLFALMLSVILAGIGIGGLISSWWYRVSNNPHLFLRVFTLANGILIVISYFWFNWVFYRIQIPMVQGSDAVSHLAFITLALSLMFPVSVISGILFTMIGRSVQEEVHSETKSAGLLTFANTTGALLGSCVAGFFLLPQLGMEFSFFLCALGYGVAAIVIPGSGSVDSKSHRTLSYIVMGGFLLLMIFFPFGRMEEKYFRIIDKKMDGAKRVATREALTETIMYYSHTVMDEPFYYRLITNGFSMSATSIEAQRYMKLFVYLPVSLNPHMKHALLLCYGVGSTAKALTNTSQLETIDVVDISEDVLDLNSIVYPVPHSHPLHDKRVSVHIEDGRFFLRTTDRRYDLITAEPPPPKLSGVVNLYSEEYFRLIYEKLSDEGIVTYWLPLHSLYEEDAKSIIKAFCNVFEDCSLWNGSGLDWILLGTKNITPVSEALFSRQWSDTVAGADLRNLGFEIPAQIGALFIADSAYLHTLTEDTKPLTDDFPLRLTTKYKEGKEYSQLYGALIEEETAERRFAQSPFINRIWPETLKKESLKYFSYQRMINNILAPAYRQEKYFVLEDLHHVLTHSTLETLPLWMVGTTYKEIEIAHMHSNDSRYQAQAEFLFAMYEVSQRDYKSAIQHMENHIRLAEASESIKSYPLYLYLLCMAGENTKAKQIAYTIGARLGTSEEIVKYWEWMEVTFQQQFVKSRYQLQK